MEGGLHAWPVTVVRPWVMAVRLLVVAAVLGVLAMHCAVHLGAEAMAGSHHPNAEAMAGSHHLSAETMAHGHPAAISVRCPAPAAVAMVSADSGSGSDPDGCCGEMCQNAFAASLAAPSISQFTAPDVAAVAVPASVDGWKPEIWHSPAETPPRRPIGLDIAALAVARI